MSPSVKRDISHIDLVTLQLGMIIFAVIAWTENVCHGKKNTTMHHYFALHCIKAIKQDATVHLNYVTLQYLYQTFRP